GLATIVAFIWAAGVYWLNPAFFWWLAPIVGALFFAVPLSVYLSRVRLGRLARKLRLFTIPEEIEPPAELKMLNAQLTPAAEEADPFVRAIVDPQVNAIHIGMLRLKLGMPIEKAKRLERIRKKALQLGPAGLTALDKADLLQDVSSMQALHLGVWQITDADLSRQWGLN
ncbi:MAG TPA: glucan biosynthesis glucosyltransferase H, partial [Gammaproteobacteria bacterium]|nr:glucan biosynthesis glucosyltransferase H [Gammaproteobacteria bacterium]